MTNTASIASRVIKTEKVNWKNLEFIQDENFKVLIKMRDTIIDYLEKEKGINEDALTAYEDGPIKAEDTEIRIMRERERIKLRDRIFELKRHIEVIKRIYPNE